MRGLVRSIARAAGAFIMLAVMVACASTQLLPEYRQSLVDSLTQANAKTLTLFASVSAGSPQGQFLTLKPRYDEMIGTFDALRIEVETRPVPPLSLRLMRTGALKELCGGDNDVSDCVNSTANKLENIVVILTEARRVHATSGLSALRVRQLKNQYEQSILDALTIENSLKR